MMIMMRVLRINSLGSPYVTKTVKKKSRQRPFSYKGFSLIQSYMMNTLRVDSREVKIIMYFLFLVVKFNPGVFF